jgi:transcriptional regulator with XRE-family HTH domain
MHEILARNVRLLMDHYNLTQTELHNKTEVSQRSISNLLRPGSIGSITSETIEKIADYFQLEYYHLLIPEIPLEELLTKRVEKLVTCYNQSTQDGRENVTRIAENEMRYSALENSPTERKNHNGR